MSAPETAAIDDSTESENPVLAYLAEHPRMVGVLFTVFLLLAQAGNVAGSESASVAGP